MTHDTRTTRSLTASTVAARAPRNALEVEREASRVLRELDDDAMVEVRISGPTETSALFPAGFLRRYLEAQDVPGRQLLVFDSDEEVSSEVAARMLGVSRPYLTELLDAEAIPYRRVGNQRRIRVLELDAYRKRRVRRETAASDIAAVVDEVASSRR